MENVCADCGNEQNTFIKCERCNSCRVITIKVAKELFGENYRDCFKEPK